MCNWNTYSYILRDLQIHASIEILYVNYEANLFFDDQDKT